MPTPKPLTTDRLRTRLYATVLACLSLLPSHLLAASCAAGGTCLFGVFPHSGMRQLQTTYAGIAEDLSLVLDRPVRLVSGISMFKFHQQTARQFWDLALLGPGQLSSVVKTQGYLPVARPATPITYQIVTLERSGIHSMAQLKGKRIGMMWRTTGTYLMTRDLIKKAGLDFEHDLHSMAYDSQAACVHALLIDVVEACGVATPILNILREQKPADYRALTISESLPSAAYVVHQRLSAEDRAEIADYLLSRENLVPAYPEEYRAYQQAFDHLQAETQ